MDGDRGQGSDGELLRDVGTRWAGRRLTPHAGTWHEGLVLVIGSHVSALGFRRRELCGCHGFACVCEYSTAANVRMVMGGARGLAGGASGWSEIDG